MASRAPIFAAAPVLIVVGAIAFAQNQGGPVLGVATVDVHTCCGGAAIRPGRVCSESHAYRGEIIVRRGRRNTGPVVARTRTNAAGEFALTLSPGVYCLVTEEKARGPLSMPAAVSDESACMQQFLSACDTVVSAPTSHRVTVRMDQPCFGRCYRGPMPP